VFSLARNIYLTPPAFSCEVEGCGRHFSVVSNLRRHKKVHKGGEARSEAGSEDRQSDE
jgi:hypothetical protein